MISAFFKILSIVVLLTGLRSGDLLTFSIVFIISPPPKKKIRIVP